MFDKSDQNNYQRQVLVDNRTYNVMSVRKGGMGKVWLLEQAFDDSFDPVYRHRIAVKTFDYMKDEKSIEQELNIWISLEHPNVLSLKKIGRLNYRLAAIMPLLDGNLEDVMAKCAQFREKHTAIVLEAIVNGLDFAWSKHKILHLDLKPSNVMVEGKETLQIKVGDWGISRLAKETSRSNEIKHSGLDMANNLTVCGAGTPLYMAPERFTGCWSLSPAIDIYSLGILAIQLSTGKLPFNQDKMDLQLEIRSQKYFENAIQILSGHSDVFRHFCLDCINPISNKRLSSYKEVFSRLNLIKRKGLS